MTSKLHTPVAFFIFRRPETTRRVFEAIAEACPTQLLVIADGPRNVQEAPLCEAARSVINVTWDCEVKTNYAITNLGLKRRMSTGLDWVFQQVEEAIIIEDDCLPHPDFFKFCQEMLDRYRDNPRIMHIGGDYFQTLPTARTSYYFSRYPHVWGWATWRRAWKLYDVKIADWCNARRKTAYLRAFHDKGERRFWKQTWDQICSGEINTWDYQWVFTLHRNHGLAITPTTNLVKNIGFGPDTTHTFDIQFQNSLPQTADGLTFPIRHPSEIERVKEADRITAQKFFSVSPPRMPLRIFLLRVWQKINLILK